MKLVSLRLTGHEIFFWSLSSNSRLWILWIENTFGIFKKTRQTLLDLIASVYLSFRSNRLDLSNNSKINRQLLISEPVALKKLN
jgi:hypothetical protein